MNGIATIAGELKPGHPQHQGIENGDNGRKNEYINETLFTLLQAIALCSQI